MPSNDFNGDGRSDILWRNGDGQVSNWLSQANGSFIINDANAFIGVPTSWHIAGTGDFNGDGRSDILWRHQSGTLSNWLGTATGGWIINDANAMSSVPNEWLVAGIGDFDGDGRDDILWRSTSGQLSNWLGTASGGFVNNDANAFAGVATNWHVVGTGDFNGDGRDDILWQSDDGYISNWLGTASGGFSINDTQALTRMRVSVAAIGDFNGDQRDDIIILDDWSFYSVHYADVTGRISIDDYVIIADAAQGWSIAGTGDYNGDDIDDLLWRHSDGTVTNALGTNQAHMFLANDQHFSVDVPTYWQIEPAYLM